MATLAPWNFTATIYQSKGHYLMYQRYKSSFKKLTSKTTHLRRTSSQDWWDTCTQNPHRSSCRLPRPARSQTVRRPPLPHAHAAAAWLRRTPPRWRSAAWHFSCHGFFKRSHDRAMISCLNVAIQFEYDLHVLKASSSNSNYIHRKWIGNFEPVVAQYKAKVQMARIIRTECDQS